MLRCAGSGRGKSLLELIVALAVLGVAVQTMAPDFVRWRERRRLRGVADVLTLTFVGMRAAAAATGRSRAIAFEGDGEGLAWSVVEDGDGDGVCRSDLANGVDVARSTLVSLRSDYPGLTAGLPVGVGPLGGGSAPRGGLALGRVRPLSVTPDGTSSTGTLYLYNRYGESVAIRVYGVTGRLTVWGREVEAARWTRLR